MVMVGPREASACQASHAAASAAIAGMSQTIEIRWRRFGAGNSEGKSISSATADRRGIPDQTWVEARSGDHRRHDNASESENSKARFDGCNLPQCDEGREKGSNEHVDGRPATNELDEPVETRALQEATTKSEPDREQQPR